jgi:excisionase family DNA binding protein
MKTPMNTGERQHHEEPPQASTSPGLDPLLVTPQEASELLRLSRSMIYLMLESGEIPSLKVGRARRIRMIDLVFWTERKVEDGR